MSYNFSGIELPGFGGYSLTSQLLYNVKFFIDWGLANAGAFEIIKRNQNTYFNTDESILRPETDLRFNSCQIWQGAGPEWIWEGGISVSSGTTPFRVSGVYINDIFHPNTEEGVFAHHVDYQNGRIIFDEPQSTGNTIQAEYVRRSVRVNFADSEEFRDIMTDAIEEYQTDTVPSGTSTREHQYWLPSIFIEIADGKQRGLQLGGGQIKNRIITLYIFADRPNERDLLRDFLDFQSRKTFVMADLNNITFPLDNFGDVVSGIVNWPDIASQHPWRKLRMIDGRSENINSINTNIFRARVRWECEIDIGSI